LTLDFCLVGVNLTLLFCLFYFLSLELVADQGAGPQSKSAAHRCPYPGCADRGAYNSADRRTAERADPGAFFARGQASPRTTDEGPQQQNDRQSRDCSFHCASWNISEG
jgi:hypothetical protein